MLISQALDLSIGQSSFRRDFEIIRCLLCRNSVCSFHVDVLRRPSANVTAFLSAATTNVVLAFGANQHLADYTREVGRNLRGKKGGYEETYGEVTRTLRDDLSLTSWQAAGTSCFNPPPYTKVCRVEFMHILKCNSLQPYRRSRYTACALA